jgi:restriction system protein
MIPKYYEISRPLLNIIKEENQSRKSASEKLSAIFNLTPEEKEKKHDSSGDYVFQNRVGWSFSYLTKAEYIELTEEKAIYRITDLGLKALKNAEEKNCVIDNKYLEENSPNFIKNWQVKKDIIKQETKNDVDEEVNDSVFNLEEHIDKVNNEFGFQLLQKIKTMSWQEFEDFCATLLEKMGYGVASKREIRVGDGGIDGEIFEDELGLRGKIYIQAKKWDNNNVQPKDMKEFLYNIKGSKGVFITTSDFSQKSRDEAKNYKDGKVALINYNDLIKLCKKYQVLCQKQTIEIFKL